MGITLLIIAISVVFYWISKTTLQQLLVLIASSIVVCWHFIGLGVISIIFLIVLTYISSLLLHKYIHFKGYIASIYVIICFGTYLFGKQLAPDSYLIPIGYSVCMFSGISLLVDSLRNGQYPSFVKTTCYMLFFPKLLAGPIERYDALMNQVTNQEDRDIKIDVYVGAKVIIYALFIKYIIADKIGIANLDQGYNGANQILSIILYGIQFYCDFWAYSLLAIGFARLFGINLMHNFNMPYRSKSFKDFWSRWNISLSLWLKDYVYIPLKTNKNLFGPIFIVFVVSALWHGVSAPFILWGVIHAMLLYFEKLIYNSKFRFIINTILYRVFVIFAVILLWQTFRVNTFTDLVNLFSTIFRIQIFDFSLLFISAISILVLELTQTSFIKNCIFSYEQDRHSIIIEVAVVTVLSLCILLFTGDVNATFFYFKF